MDWIAFTWAALVSGFAYWLGNRAGWQQATSCTALLFWKCGVRGIDSSTRTITFRDGSTRTDRSDA